MSAGTTWVITVGALTGASSTIDFCVNAAAKGEKKMIHFSDGHGSNWSSCRIPPRLLRRLFDLAGGKQNSLCNAFNNAL